MSDTYTTYLWYTLRVQWATTKKILDHIMEDYQRLPDYEMTPDERERFVAYARERSGEIK